MICWICQTFLLYGIMWPGQQKLITGAHLYIWELSIWNIQCYNGTIIQVTIQIQWDQLCAKGAVNGFQTTLQSKAGRLITIMDNWEQLNHTNATLLKPTKYFQTLIMQSSTGPWKSRLEKQTWLSMVILLWCPDSARV